jgi:hypothetical protein
MVTFPSPQHELAASQQQLLFFENIPLKRLNRHSFWAQGSASQQVGAGAQHGAGAGLQHGAGAGVQQGVGAGVQHGAGAASQQSPFLANIPLSRSFSPCLSWQQLSQDEAAPQPSP